MDWARLSLVFLRHAPTFIGVLGEIIREAHESPEDTGTEARDMRQRIREGRLRNDNVYRGRFGTEPPQTPYR